MSSFEKKYRNLKSLLNSIKPIMVAFSGGVDSSFLLLAARDAVGEKVSAVTVETELHQPEEIKTAKDFTAGLKIPHVILKTDILGRSDFTVNPPDRCYVCKKILFAIIKEHAALQGVGSIIEGTHADDAADYRPGIQALREAGIQSPLAETEISKQEIRTYLKNRGIALWHKPAEPCLATRIPFGTEITAHSLSMIAQAESFLKKMGFQEVRVRFHDDSARIEVAPEEIQRLTLPENSGVIAAQLKDIGFTYISVDIEGYKRGSMNRVLSKDSDNG